MNLARMLEDSPAHGDAEYLVDAAAGRRVTFVQNHTRAHALAAALADGYGVRRGDRVALLAANSIEWITAFWAVQALGGVVVAMNSRWAAPEIAHALELTAPSLVIADAARRPLLAEALATLPGTPDGAEEGDAVTHGGAGAQAGAGSRAGSGAGAGGGAGTGAGTGGGAGLRGGGGAGAEGRAGAGGGAGLRGGVAVLPTEEVQALIDTHGGASVAAGQAAADEDPATILFTSGTTGRAKGVVHPHRSLVATAERQRAGRDADPDARRYLLATPLFHVAALHNLSVPRLLLGDAAVLSTGRFDIDAVTLLIERERITHWSAVPTMAARLVALLEARPEAADRVRTLRALSLITAPAAEGLQRRLRERVPTVRAALAATYGLTETACPATAATDADLRADPLCVGTPVPRMEVRIAGGAAEAGEPGRAETARGDGGGDSGHAVRGDGGGSGHAVRGDGGGSGHAVRGDGGDAEPGVRADSGVGEIQVRGPHLMSGYWRDEAATLAAFTADGWLRTGDIGEFVDGRLRVHSRRTDLIIRGGENVYPAEVEAVLEAHPAVAECMVHGAPDDDWGQVVCAVIVPARDLTPDTARDLPPDMARDLPPELVRGLSRHASARLAAYKVPTRWSMRREPLPRNASGKVVRGRVLHGAR